MLPRFLVRPAAHRSKILLENSCGVRVLRTERLSFLAAGSLAKLNRLIISFDRRFPRLEAVENSMQQSGFVDDLEVELRND